eukprot:gene14650-16168_t
MIKIDVDVVDNDIPLLIGRPTMTEAGNGACDPVTEGWGMIDQEFLVEVEKEVNKGKLWILHLVDEATRYTAAAVIDTKRTEVVVEKIFKIWLAYFGTPKKMHSDNGGEFSSHVMREMHEKLILRQEHNFAFSDTSKLPALDSRINSDVVRENLNAMHKARESYIKAESSEKIMRALKRM